MKNEILSVDVVPDVTKEAVEEKDVDVGKANNPSSSPGGSTIVYWTNDCCSRLYKLL